MKLDTGSIENGVDHEWGLHPIIPRKFEHNNIDLILIGGEYRISHTQIADALGETHEIVRKLIKDNSDEIEKTGGYIVFASPEESFRKSKKDVYLNELQAMDVIRPFLNYKDAPPRHLNMLEAFQRVRSLRHESESKAKHLEWWGHASIGTLSQGDFYEYTEEFFECVADEIWFDPKVGADKFIGLINDACNQKSSRVATSLELANISTAALIVLNTLETSREEDYGYKITMQLVERKLNSFSRLLRGALNANVYSV